MEKKKQIKDLSDLPVLRFLMMLRNEEIVHIYNVGDKLQVYRPTMATSHEGFAHSILNALPYGEAYPDKLRRAKIRSMVRRGLVDGCLCGCRGDFTITDKGIERIIQLI